jgi:predicted outer membrane repeat protein
MSSQIIRRWIVSFALALSMLAVIGLVVGGSAHVRASGGGTPWPGACGLTLQDCINSTTGSEIDIAAGVYTESFTLDKAVSLKGDGITTTFLIAASNDRVLTVTGSVISNSVKISGLTFQGGNLSGGVGGGILIDNGAQPDIRDIALIGNHADQGGGLYASVGSTLTLESVSVLSNSATGLGGGIYVGSRLAISNSNIQNNSGGSGGGLYTDGKLEMTLVNVVSNSASTGGGVFVNNAEAHIVGGSFELNVSTNGSGGGLNVAAGDVYLEYPIFINNAAYGLTAGSGGGAHFGDGHIGVMSGYFDGNYAEMSGGALDKINSGGLDVGYVCFYGNGSASAAVGGGAIHSSSPLTVTQSCFDSNTSLNLGGAIFADNAPALVAQTKFVNNQANSGGGVYLNGPFGGRIENSLFARNLVTNTGTALYLDSNGSISVTHNTIGDVIINPSPAIAVNAGLVTIQDTIVASHSIGISVTAGSVFQDYNLFFHNIQPVGGPIVNGTHNLNGQDPRFYDPFSDDYHLGAGSAAINSGVDAGVTIDYDWDPRPLLGAFDIGYDESHNSPSLFSIQAAIDGAPNNGTVFIPPGVYVESLNLYKPVNLMGGSSSGVFIYGNGTDRVLTVSVPLVTNTIVISGVTLIGGNAYWTDCQCGGGVLITRTNFVSLQNVVVSGSLALRGGGVYLAGGSLALRGSNIANNSAIFGAGIYEERGAINLFSGTIGGNAANTSGGGVYVQANPAVLNQWGGSIQRNTAQDGAGVFVQDGQFDQTGGDIFDNAAWNWGGGVLAANTNSLVKLNGGKVFSNSAYNGGGVFIDLGSVDFSLGQIVSNTAAEGGGAFVFSSTAILTQSAGSIMSNTAGNGGGVAVYQGRFKLLNGSIAGNVASNDGGAIFLNDPAGQVVQSGGTIIQNQAAYGGAAKIINGRYYLLGGEIGLNQATYSGGGIYVYDVNAALNQIGGLIDRNTASDGGGVLVDMGSALFNGGSISNNTAASGKGGGLYMTGNSTVTLLASNISGNSAGSYGGGIYAGGSITLPGIQLSNNSATDGGGVYAGGVANLNNTVLLSNTATTGNGGGLSGWAEVVAVNSTFTANQCDGATCEGGGLYTNNLLVLTNTDFLSNTSAYNGGGVWGDANIWITGGKFNNNNSPAGGGAALGTNSDVTLTNVSFIGNHGGLATSGGAVWAMYGSAQVSGGLFRNNLGGYGGAINAEYGTVWASGTSFIGNQASSSGGAIFANQVNLNTVYLLGNDALGNIASLAPAASGFGGGGGVYAATTSIITGSTLLNNQSAYHNGGGVYATDLIVNSTEFGGNSAGENGGGVYVENSAASTRSTFTNNTSQARGGGLAAMGQVAVTATKFMSNSAATDGGAIDGSFDVMAVDSLFSTNTAGNNGGGIFVNDSATLQRNRFANNSAAQGGGVYANSSTAGDQLNVARSKFLGNSADVGGGLYHTGLGSGSIVNSLFAHNHAITEADGLSLNSTGEVDVMFLTLANPLTVTGQAIVVNAGTVNVTNTIVTSYSIGLKQTGGSVAEDYNLYFGNTSERVGLIGLGGNSLIGLDPRFVKPSIDDYHLSLFSPAVDVAVDLGVINDLGGWPRPTGPGFDIGAFELQAQSTNVGPTNGGQLTYVDNQGLTTTMVLPSGLVTTSTTIIFNNLNTDVITQTPPGGLMFISKLFDIDAFLGSIQLHNITFTRPVTLVLHYSDADVAGIDEHSLRLYRFETSLNDWRPIGFRRGESQELDVDNNTLTVVLFGFSRFAKLGSNQFYEVFLPLVMK